MAAIDVHIGTQAPEDRRDDSCAVQYRPDGVLSGPRKCVPPVEQMHVGQTRMVWVRRALTDWITQSGIQYRLAQRGKDLGFEISEPFRNTQFQWLLDKSQKQSFYILIGEAGKMGCPTWDLPAGSPVLGGACPAATAGQSTVPIQIRKKAEPAVGEPIRLAEAICQICYAEGGNYSTFTMQLGELLRFWWTQQLLDEGRDEEWISTMVEAIQRSPFPIERVLDPRTGRPVLPMRVHSSGDFYSQRYAKAWIEIANRVPDVLFWAPTRTWAAGGWVDFWRENMAKATHKNLVIRPSAYHTDDPAISEGHREIPCQTFQGVVSRPETPWEGSYPFSSRGTTAVYKNNDMNSAQGRGIEQIVASGSVDPRYDWQCGTYAILNDAHSCRNAIAPDGQVGCRACWVHPDLRVNYTAH